MMKEFRTFNISAEAPGLQALSVTLPAHFPEKGIDKVMKLLKPLLRQQSVGCVVHIAADGKTEAAVLRDLARRLANL